MVAGSHYRHPVAIQISRSVIIPTTCPRWSPIGSTPQARIHIDSAAVAKSVFGEHVFTSFVITSFTFMLPFCRADRAVTIVLVRNAFKQQRPRPAVPRA